MLKIIKFNQNMLILTRKIGESIVIGNDIFVILLEQRGAQIRVGIKAPRRVKVYREEVYKQIMEENKRAARSSGDQDVDQLSDYFKDLKSKKTSKDTDGGDK